MTSPTGPDPYEGSGARPGRIGWRRGVLGLLVLAGAAIAVEHIVGGQMSLWVLAAGVGVIGLIAGVWRFPHLMRHFHPFGLRERRQRSRTTTRTFGSPRKAPGSLLAGRKGGGGRMLPKLGGSRARRGTGSGRAGSGSRRLLPGLGRRGKTGLGKSRAGGGPARKSMAATRASGRTPGAGRRKLSPFRRSGGTGGGKRRPALGLKRTGSGRKASPFRRNRGGSRKNGAHRGGSRSPASRRLNRHRIAAARHAARSARAARRAGPGRHLTRPSTWRRRNRNGQANGRNRNGQANGRRALGTPQRLNRRQAWKARRAARATARQARQGRLRSRLGFAGWALRHPSTWRRPRTAPQRPPGRMRRGLHRVIGTPQQRHNRRSARKAHRANQRARRIRLARNPYGARFRWYAPWRAWTRGPGARALFHRWRVNRGHVAPRGRNGRKLPWGMRARRRWNIWRGNHRGLGFGQQPRARRQLLAGLRRRWQNRRPPLPLARHGQPRWMQRMLGRADQSRANRWAQRRRRSANSPLRPPSAPRPKIAVAGHWAPARNLSNLASPGGHMTDPMHVAEEIRSLMAGDFHDSNHAHDILTNLAEIVRAAEETLTSVAEKVQEAPGITNDYAEAAHEAAGGMSGIADQLQEKIGLGIVN